MKFTYLLIFCFLCCSNGCAPSSKYLQGSSKTYILDFTSYSNREFLFTPEKYQGKYNSIGLIEFEFICSATCEQNIESFGSSEYRYWVKENFKISDGLEHVYEEVIKLGGNALINFDIRHLDEIGSRFECQESYFAGGYVISGFAIKRID